MIRATVESLLNRLRAWKFAKGFVLAALLAIPFGLYYVAANFSTHATAGLLGLFGLFMLFVLLEG